MSCASGWHSLQRSQIALKTTQRFGSGSLSQSANSTLVVLLILSYMNRPCEYSSQNHLLRVRAGGRRHSSWSDMVVRKVKDFTSSNSISVITELSSSGTYSGSSVDCGEGTTIRTAGYLQVAAEEADLRHDVEVFAEEEEEERDQEDQHEHQRRILI